MKAKDIESSRSGYPVGWELRNIHRRSLKISMREERYMSLYPQLRILTAWLLEVVKSVFFKAVFYSRAPAHGCPTLVSTWAAQI